MTARKIAQENGWPALGASLRELHSVNDYLVQAVHGLLNRPTTAPPGPGFAGEGVWWAILPVQPEVLRLTQEDGRRIKVAHIRRGKELSVNVCPIIAVVARTGASTCRGRICPRAYRVSGAMRAGSRCTARSNPAPRHAPIRHLKTLESGTPSRSNPAPENGRKRHLITE